jgi:hypothetical protein
MTTVSGRGRRPTRSRLTEADHQNRRLTEAEFLNQVIELAHLTGWRVAHFRPALTARGWRTPVQADGAGFPDLVMTRRERCIAAELKREVGGAISPEQVAWLAAFDAAGLETAIWRPSDFDRIAEALR